MQHASSHELSLTCTMAMAATGCMQHGCMAATGCPGTQPACVCLPMQCGHCQQLTPIYSRVAENLYGIVTIGAVDCDVESNKQLCGQYGVKGFPTLKVFPAGQQQSSKTGRVNKTPEDYNGAHSTWFQREPVGVTIGCIGRLEGRGRGRVCGCPNRTCQAHMHITGLLKSRWHEFDYRTSASIAGPRSAKSIADAASAGLTDAFIQRPSSQAEFDKFRATGAALKVVVRTARTALPQKRD